MTPVLPASARYHMNNTYVALFSEYVGNIIRDIKLSIIYTGTKKEKNIYQLLKHLIYSPPVEKTKYVESVN